MNVTSTFITAAACLGLAANSALAEYPPNDCNVSESASRTVSCYDHVHVASDLALGLPVGATSRNFDGLGRRMLNSIGGGAAAGDIFEDWSVAVVGSHTEFDDSALGIDGEANSVSLQLSANHGDNIVGLGFTIDALDVENGGGVDTTTVDGYYGFTLNENFTAGVLGSLSLVEADASSTEEQYGMGAFLAGNAELSDMFSIGGVTALSYIDGIGQSEWLWNSVADISAQVCEHSNIALYAGYTDTIEASLIDGYITLGAEITYTISDVTTFSIGYEQTAEHDTTDDETFVVQFSHSF